MYLQKFCPYAVDEQSQLRISKERISPSPPPTHTPHKSQNLKMLSLPNLQVIHVNILKDYCVDCQQQYTLFLTFSKNSVVRQCFNNLTAQVKDELQLITILTVMYLSNTNSSKEKHVLLCFLPHLIKPVPR